MKLEVQSAINILLFFVGFVFGYQSLAMLDYYTLVLSLILMALSSMQFFWDNFLQIRNRLRIVGMPGFLGKPDQGHRNACVRPPGKLLLYSMGHLIYAGINHSFALCTLPDCDTNIYSHLADLCG